MKAILYSWAKVTHKWMLLGNLTLTHCFNQLFPCGEKSGLAGARKDFCFSLSAQSRGQKIQWNLIIIFWDFQVRGSKSASVGVTSIRVTSMSPLPPSFAFQLETLPATNWGKHLALWSFYVRGVKPGGSPQHFHPGEAGQMNIPGNLKGHEESQTYTLKPEWKVPGKPSMESSIQPWPFPAKSLLTLSWDTRSWVEIEWICLFLLTEDKPMFQDGARILDLSPH